MSRTANQAPVFVHVGLSKAASTFLQRRFFPSLEGLRFVKKRRFGTYPQRLQEPGDAPWLFTAESNLSAPAHFERLRSFAQHAPNAQPLLMLRRQDRRVASMYKNHLKKSGGDLPAAFFDLATGGGRFPERSLVYRDKIRFLEEVFPAHPPLVFFQEELIHAPGAVMAELADWLGARLPAPVSTANTNPAWQERELVRLRAFNRRFPFQELPRERGRWRRLMHKRPREGVVLLLSALARQLPPPDEPLFPPGYLAAVRTHFRADWAASLAYARTVRGQLHLPPAEEEEASA